MHDHSASDNSGNRCYYVGGSLRSELVNHLPFSVSSVTVGLIAAGIICFLAPESSLDPVGAHADPSHAHGARGEFHGGFIELFHLFHPAHMLFSAAATTAMFRRYDRRTLLGLLVGFTGAVLVCGVSDIVFPQIALILLGKAPADWHVCILNHPGIVFPFAVVGVGLGWIAADSMRGATFFSHTLHVFISSMASIFFLVGPLGRLEWIDDIGAVFGFTVVAVMIPCCFSDILYPLLLTRRGREEYAHSEHARAHEHDDSRAHEH